MEDQEHILDNLVYVDFVSESLQTKANYQESQKQVGNNNLKLEMKNFKLADQKGKCKIIINF